MLLIASLLFSIVTVANAQMRVFTPADMEKGIVCDKQRFRVAYEMTFVVDTTRTPYIPEKETMILQIGKSTSLFFSYPSFRSDSILNDDFAKNASQATINEHLSHVDCGRIYWSLYKNYPKKGTFTLLDAIGMDRYSCTESLKLPEWKIIADSTKTILGYSCHLATAIYKGRKWSAWYAEDIPLSEGPWKLCGLPGLILSAYDAQHQYIFAANGMEQIKGDENIFYKGAKFEPINKEMLNKIYIRYNADPLGYMNSNPNHHVTVTDKDGNPTKPSPIAYNPIER